MVVNFCRCQQEHLLVPQQPNSPSKHVCYFVSLNLLSPKIPSIPSKLVKRVLCSCKASCDFAGVTLQSYTIIHLTRSSMLNSRSTSSMQRRPDTDTTIVTLCIRFYCISLCVHVVCDQVFSIIDIYLKIKLSFMFTTSKSWAIVMCVTELLHVLCLFR